MCTSEEVVEVDSCCTLSEALADLVLRRVYVGGDGVNGAPQLLHRLAQIRHLSRCTAQHPFTVKLSKGHAASSAAGLKLSCVCV